MKKKRCEELIGNISIILPVVAAGVAVCAFICCYFLIGRLNGERKNSAVIDEPAGKVEATETEDKPTYISETNYTGHLSAYPELYEIPFKKSDAYICNKDFYEAHYEIFKECEDDATAFIESLFNVNYRVVAEDEADFVSDVMANGDYEAYVTKNYGMEDEETICLLEHIREISDYFIENQVEMEAKFYTDDSLVYSDFYTFVRGELVFTIYNTEDKDSEYEIGKEYQIPVEVAMHRTPSSPQDRTVCSFGKAEDDTFFLTP